MQHAVTPRLVGRPYLCVSDIQGDLAALEAVLAAVRHIELAGVIACGNHVVGGPQPFEVWTRLMSLGAHLTCGPTDLAVATVDSLAAHAARAEAVAHPLAAQLASIERARDALGDLVARRLGELPSTLVVSLDDLRGVMASYCSPADFDGPLADDEHLADRVAAVAEDVFVCGGQVRPFARRVMQPLPLLTLDNIVDAEERETITDELAREPVRELLVVNVGVVVGQARPRRVAPIGAAPARPDRRRTANAVLVGSADDGNVHAFGADIAVGRARTRRVG